MKRYIDIALVIIVFSLGMLADHYIFPQYKDKLVKQDPKIVYVQGEATTNTIVKYILKETDPVTGQQENTDVQISIPKPELNISLNNKIFTLQPDFDEDYLFENGKLVLNQSSKFDLNIKLPEPKRSFELGGYLGTDGVGGIVVIPRKDKGSYIVMVGPEWNFQKWDARYGVTW